MYRAINCGSFRCRPLFTILHIELLFRALFMAIQTYDGFSSFAFVRKPASNASTRDRCQVTASRRLLYGKNTRGNFARARAFFTITAKLSRITNDSMRTGISPNFMSLRRLNPFSFTSLSISMFNFQTRSFRVRNDRAVEMRFASALRNRHRRDDDRR